MPKQKKGWETTKKWLVGGWGVVISLLTVVLMFGQYETAKATLRPSLAIGKVLVDKATINEYGAYSHSYVFTNLGATHANAAMISVVTKIGGSVVHEDRRDPLGLIAPKEEHIYEIHVHKHVAKDFDLKKDALTELVSLEYEGAPLLLRFWCTPTYSFTVGFQYDPRMSDWFIKDPAREEEKCK